MIAPCPVCFPLTLDRGDDGTGYCRRCSGTGSVVVDFGPEVSPTEALPMPCPGCGAGLAEPCRSGPDGRHL